MNMLKYIMNENRNNEIKGVALWKDMEILQVIFFLKSLMIILWEEMGAAK